jgi:hypothetical protein
VLAVPAIRDAIDASRGHTVYVANQRATVDTEGFDVAAHVAVQAAHGVIPDLVVADTAGIALGDVPLPVVTAPMARPDGLAHDPAALGVELARLV